MTGPGGGASRPGAWLVGPPARGVRRWLLCFPHAGAGPGVFASWSALLPPDLGFRTVQAPGRGLRLREPAHREVRPLVGDLLPVVAALSGRPITLFGHSVGALEAFELARAMRAAGLPPPEHLYVSGRGAPRGGPPKVQAWDLDDAELVAWLRGLGGTPDEFLDDTEMMAMVLPGLRADLEVNERYAYTEEPPLDVPITAFAAAADDRPEPLDLVDWGHETTVRFDLVPLDGGHFAVLDNPLVVLDRVLAGTRSEGGVR